MSIEKTGEKVINLILKEAKKRKSQGHTIVIKTTLYLSAAVSATMLVGALKDLEDKSDDRKKQFVAEFLNTIEEMVEKHATYNSSKA